MRRHASDRYGSSRGTNVDADTAADGFPCANIDIEYDGLTVVLTVSTPVNPGTNHIKLAIADSGDSILDSSVFLGAESFVCAPPNTPPTCSVDCSGTCEHFYQDENGAWVVTEGETFQVEFTGTDPDGDRDADAYGDAPTDDRRDARAGVSR